MSKNRSFNARKLVSAALIVVMSMFAIVGVAAAQDADQTETEAANRAYLGVYYSNVDEGARIDQVIPDSPAEEAGLEAADIITAVGEEAVAENFADLIATYAAGDVITLSVTRGEETLEIEVTLGDAPAPEAANEGFRFDFGGNDRGPGGNFQFRMQLGEVEFLEDENAWEIGELSEDSVLAEAGLQTGDKVTAITIDGEALELDDRGQLRAMDMLMGDHEIVLTIERDGETQEIDVEPSVAAMLVFSANFGGLEMIPNPINPEFQVPDMRDFRELVPGMPRLPQALGVRLGVGFVMLDENGAEQYGVEQTEGAYITQVADSSPAGAAGLEIGDVVTEVDGEALTLDFNLRDAIADNAPGDVLTLTVVRAGESQEIAVTLGQPEQFGMTEQG